MKCHGLVAVLAILAGATSTVGAQAIVDATGATPGSFTTISAALAGTDSEIIVKNTGLYTEALMITRNVVLRGEDPNDRPIIAMQGNASQPVLGPGDGIYIGGTVGGTTDQTIEFKNFIVIPALSNGPTDDAFSISPNTNAVLTVTIENVLCAPNDGANQPLATSVWDNPDFGAPGVVRIPDDGVYLMDDQFAGFNGDVKATLTDFVIIGVGGGTNNGDALVLYPGDGGQGSIDISGVGTSYSSRYAAQTDYDVVYTITGSQENPGWVARKNAIGIIFFQAGVINADHLVAVENNNVGIRVDADTVGTFNATDSLFAGNATQGIYIPFASAVPKAWTISNTTFFNNGIGNINATAATTPDLTVTITDSIFAGNVSPGIWNEGAANFIVDNSALVTEGPHALSVATEGTVTVNNSISADPMFVSTAVDPLIEDSFDVTSSAYATASSTGGNLNGWGDGPTPSKVSDWTLY